MAIIDSLRINYYIDDFVCFSKVIDFYNIEQ